MKTTKFKKSATCGTKAEGSVRLGTEFRAPRQYPICEAAKFLINNLRKDSRIPEIFIWDLKRQFRLSPRSDQKRMAECLLSLLKCMYVEDYENIPYYAKTGVPDIDYYLSISFTELFWFTNGIGYLRSQDYSYEEARTFQQAVTDFYIRRHLHLKKILEIHK